MIYKKQVFSAPESGGKLGKLHLKILIKTSLREPKSLDQPLIEIQEKYKKLIQLKEIPWQHLNW